MLECHSGLLLLLCLLPQCSFLLKEEPGWTEKSDPGETPSGGKPIRSLTSQTPRRSAVPYRIHEPSSGVFGYSWAVSGPHRLHPTRLRLSGQHNQPRLSELRQTVRLRQDEKPAAFTSVSEAGGRSRRRYQAMCPKTEDT